jgi:hypothetical protein
VGRLWKGNTTGFGYEAIACFERGLVWDGHEPGFDYQAVASYGKRRIWTGANKGFNYEAIGCYDNERIWNGHDPGFQYEAVGYYSEGLIWEGNNEGFNYEAVGAYEGSPVGAAAAALIYLLGGGQASDTSSSSDEESEESDDDFHDDASDDDDDYDYETEEDDDDDDAPSYVSEPYTPPIVEDPPEVVAARRFAAATTLPQVYEIRDQLVSAGKLSSDAIKRLYQGRAEEVETRRIDGLFSKMKGKTVEQLHEEYNKEFKALNLEELEAQKYLALESYEMYMLAEARHRIWNEWKDLELRAWARWWSDEFPYLSILAARRLKEITERETEEQATAALAKLEPVERVPNEQIASFFYFHWRAEIALKVVPRVNDKYALGIAYRECRRFPIGEALKRRYLEILDAEYARLGFWEKLLYRWFGFGAHERKVVQE